MPRKSLPIAKDKLLHLEGHNLPFGSEEFYRWLRRPGTKSFRAETSLGSFTASKRTRNRRNYWYASRSQWGIVKNVFIGDDSLAWENIEAAAAKLNIAFAPLEEMEAAGENAAIANNDDSDLAQLLRQKDEEIAALRQQLEKMKIERDRLEAEVMELHARNGDLGLQLQMQDEQLAALQQVIPAQEVAAAADDIVQNHPSNEAAGFKVGDRVILSKDFWGITNKEPKIPAGTKAVVIRLISNEACEVKLYEGKDCHIWQDYLELNNKKPSAEENKFCEIVVNKSRLRILAHAKHDKDWIGRVVRVASISQDKGEFTASCWLSHRDYHKGIIYLSAAEVVPAEGNILLATNIKNAHAFNYELDRASQEIIEEAIAQCPTNQKAKLARLHKALRRLEEPLVIEWDGFKGVFHYVPNHPSGKSLIGVLYHPDGKVEERMLSGSDYYQPDSIIQTFKFLLAAQEQTQEPIPAQPKKWDERVTAFLGDVSRVKP